MKNNLIGIAGGSQEDRDTVGKILQYLDWEKTNGKCEKEFNEILTNGIFIPKGMRSFTSVFNESNYQIKKFADKPKDMVCLLIGCTREQLEDRGFKEKELGEEWDFYEAGEWNERFILAANIPYDETKYRGLIKQKMTPRLLLQLLGTECGRQIIHPNIWVNALFADYKASSTQYGNVPYFYQYGNWRMECKHKGDYFEGTNGETQFSLSEEELIEKGATKVYYLSPNWIITDVRFPNEAQAIVDRANSLLIRVERPNFVSESNHESETALDNYEGFDEIIINDGSIEDLIGKVRAIWKKYS